MHDGNLANLGANSASQIGLGTLRVYFDGINTKSTTFFFLCLSDCDNGAGVGTNASMEIPPTLRMSSLRFREFFLRTKTETMQ